MASLTVGLVLSSGLAAWADDPTSRYVLLVDPRQVLARVAQLPIQTWKYKAQDAAIRHIGPMAQDFYAAFNVGEDDKHITEVDEGGVALAAIQGLYKLVQDQQTLMQQQQKRLRDQQAEIAALKARLDSLQQQR